MAARTTPTRHINSPWGEVTERSEGGGEAREGNSGRATAGSDKRPRPSNTHEQGSFGTADGEADTAQILPGSAEQCLEPLFVRATEGAQRERSRAKEGGSVAQGRGDGRLSVAKSSVSTSRSVVPTCVAVLNERQRSRPSECARYNGDSVKR